MKGKLNKPLSMIEKRKSMAEKMMEDMVKVMKDMQKEFEKRISEYTEVIPTEPSLDLIETDDKIIIKTDLPGVKKEDINIELTEDTITIGATFKEELEVKEANYIKKERKYGKARRELRLPAKIKVDEAKAKFKEGVLTVELPKIEVKKKHTIKVE